MPRKNDNARYRWKPSPEQLDRLEFGTPHSVDAPEQTTDNDLGFVLVMYIVLVAYFFVADVVAMVEVVAMC